MDIRAILMGLAFALMWSSAFTSARIIVESAPPLTALAIRFAISGAIGVALAAILGQSARLSHRQWGAVVLFGICQNAIYLGLNFVAMQTIEASLAAIIASTMPLLVALAGWLIFGEKIKLEQYTVKKEAGSVVAFPSNFCFPHAITPISNGDRYAIITWIH